MMEKLKKIVELREKSKEANEKKSLVKNPHGNKELADFWYFYG